MRLCPNKTSVDQLNSIQSSDLTQTNRQQLLRFPLRIDPWRTQVPSAESTIVQYSLFGDSNCDVCPAYDTGGANVACFGNEHNAASGTENLSLGYLLNSLHFHFYNKQRIISLSKYCRILIISFIIW